MVRYLMPDEFRTLWLVPSLSLGTVTVGKAIGFIINISEGLVHMLCY